MYTTGHILGCLPWAPVQHAQGLRILTAGAPEGCEPHPLTQVRGPLLVPSAPQRVKEAMGNEFTATLKIKFSVRETKCLINLQSGRGSFVLKRNSPHCPPSICGFLKCYSGRGCEMPCVGVGEAESCLIRRKASTDVLVGWLTYEPLRSHLISRDSWAPKGHHLPSA